MGSITENNQEIKIFVLVYVSEGIKLLTGLGALMLTEANWHIQNV